MSNIIPDLADKAVPIGNVKGLTGNPRKGDVEAVARSLEAFGQRKPIVVRRYKKEKDGFPTGEVIAGNHTLLAAQALGWDRIAVAWTDDDPKTAKAFALADNRTHDLGGYDESLLGEMLADLADADTLLAATGYTEGEVQDLLASLTTPDDGVPSTPTGMGQPVISYQIVFDTEQQQQQWYAFMRWLRDRNPDASTLAERLTAYLEEAMA